MKTKVPTGVNGRSPSSNQSNSFHIHLYREELPLEETLKHSFHVEHELLSSTERRSSCVERRSAGCPSFKEKIQSMINSIDRFKIRNPNNEEDVYELRSKQMLFDQQTCHLIIIRDITDLVKTEYARSIEKLSEVMIASTSHDMRTPLNSILNMLHLLQDMVTDSQLAQMIRVAINSSQLLLFLVSDTLDYF